MDSLKKQVRASCKRKVTAKITMGNLQGTIAPIKDQAEKMTFIDQQVDEMKKKVIRDYITSLFKIGQFPDESYQEIYNLTKKNVAESKATDSNTYAFFVTVRPPDTVPDGVSIDSTEYNLKLLETSVKKCLSKKWLKDYVYVYEQTGEKEGDYRGIHIHMLITRPSTKRPSHGKRELINTFKSVGITDVKLVPQKWYADKIEYILGKKTGEGKDIKQKNDILFRAKYKLHDYYSNNA